MPGIGVITGLAREARCLAGRGAGDVKITSIGPNPARAHAAARGLIAVGCEALMSFGICGALDPRLATGNLIVADRIVLADGQVIPTDAAWRDRLLDASAKAGLTGNDLPTVAPVASVETLVAGPAGKAALQEATGAAAADMESGEVARAALEAGVPFLALRAVADAADTALPEWSASAIDADGEVRLIYSIGRLIAAPLGLGTALRAATETRRALATLRRVAFLADRRFAF